MSASTIEINPEIIDCPLSPPDWSAWDARVRKIVLGKMGDEAAYALAALPTDFADRFPALTHLYLWGISGLKELPALPPGLLCLEARNCPDLVRLAELPGKLETLDVGGCSTLARLPKVAPGRLIRFNFNGCAKLESHRLASFLEELEECGAPVVEIDGSDCPAVTALAEFPAESLRKLVLQGCGKLTDAAGLGDFHSLEHLNLSGCAGLTDLPDLPGGLRYLALHGAVNLAHFRGQDIGPYDRGAEKQNVARTFMSRKKFGKDLAVMPHSKLLLMGDGRVGKSTLAKRLQWEEKPSPEVKPDKDEPFTHRVRFWRWETGLALPEGEMNALDERAAAAKTALPKSAGGHLDGALRLWDFGGQEIYHSTHRIFAGEGSVFLVVWRAEPPAIGNPPPDVTPEEWEEWNRHRPLDYWLDYIYSMRPDAEVALVCTNCPNPDKMPSKPDWRARAPKHVANPKRPDLPSFCVDSLAEDCGSHGDYRRMVTWIRETCGAEAKRIGILQPRFYRQVSDLLDGWLAENSKARHEGRRAEHVLCPWSAWQKSVRHAYAADPACGDGALELEENDIATITDYLHQAGHLFQIRHEAHRAVLVDQEWAADLIYQILLCGGSLRQTVKANGGWFYRASLEDEAHWKSLADDLQRERLLAYMEECRVVTRIATADRNRLGHDVYLASDKWLLPPYEAVETQVETLLGLVRKRAGVEEREKFEFEELTMSEFDFRALQAQVARTFGTRAVYFRTGFQAIEEGAQPGWGFRLRWLEQEGDPFTGKIDGVMFAEKGRLDRLAAEIEDLFFAEGSPIADRRKPVKRQAAEDRDLGHAYFRGLRQEEHDVAVSSSGADKEEAEALVGALLAAGYQVNWYRREECRAEDKERVFTFMNSLSQQPCIVLLLSAGYLRDDPENNWYCAWELADAIQQLGDGKRTAERTLAVYRESKELTSSNLNDVIVPLLKRMGEYFAERYARVPGKDRKNFKYFDDFSAKFFDALEGDKCRRFFEARGTLGSYLSVPADPNAPDAHAPLIAAVAKATGKKPK